MRLGQGNLSNVKGVGEGVLEYRIKWGPGYRVYFGRDGETANRRHQKAPGAGHRARESDVGGLQAATKAASAMNGDKTWH
jgi:putative component of toxin-antitoxin plasmid stabilization module